jgi:hypothetical protein
MPLPFRRFAKLDFKVGGVSQFTELVPNQEPRTLQIIHFLGAIVETVKHAQHRI